MTGSRVGEGYDGDDFYCDVAIPHAHALDVVHEDDRVLAFEHTRPFWESHVVITPKRHIGSLTTVGPEDHDDVSRLLVVVQEVARRFESRYGEAAGLTNLGRYQDSKHLHIHVHRGPRRRG